MEPAVARACRVGSEDGSDVQLETASLVKGWPKLTKETCLPNTDVCAFILLQVR